MQGRVRQKLNTNKIFTNMCEKPLLIFLVYMLNILWAYVRFIVQKLDDSGVYIVFLFYQSNHHAHIMFKNLGNNKQENINLAIRISLLFQRLFLITYRL